MNRILLGFLLLASASCMSQKVAVCGQDRIENIGWLKEMLEGKEKAAVFAFKYESETVLEFHHCYQCPDALVIYYDCSGKKICESGGFMGMNTCPEFDTSDKRQLYPLKE